MTLRDRITIARAYAGVALRVGREVGLGIAEGLARYGFAKLTRGGWSH